MAKGPSSLNWFSLFLALLAIGGGYGVWVGAAGSRHIVAVTTGLFANALVQVTASQIQAGDLVEVPAP